jgi:acetyl esterase/lipase
MLAFPASVKGYLARDYQLFAVEKKDQKVGGVHAFVYAPKSGVSAKNKDRVLINLHGGGFSVAGLVAQSSSLFPFLPWEGLR